MLFCRAAVFLCAGALAMSAQEATRTKDVREIAKAGSTAIPRLQQFLTHASLEIRVEAVKQIVEIGGQHSLDPLVQATRDNDPEIQVRATDGLVNFYLPGYVKTGLSASVRRVGGSIKGRFTDTNDQLIDPFIQVRPDIVEAIGKLARGGAGMDVRANAARAVGVLRGKTAVKDLIEAIRTKDNDVIYESLVALQKIRDESAAPLVEFLIRDFDQRVQIAAIETAGLLRNQSAVPQLTDALSRARDNKVRRAALASIAMLPQPGSRELFARYLADRDERLRGAAAEGFARLKNPADLPLIDSAYEAETKTSPRLSMAFAAVALGRNAPGELTPFQYLINTLNSNSWRGEAFPLLVELARDGVVRQALYRPMASGTRDEKIWLARVLARSGDAASAAELRKLQNDGDVEVSQEAVRAIRTLGVGK